MAGGMAVLACGMCQMTQGRRLLAFPKAIEKLEPGMTQAQVKELIKDVNPGAGPGSWIVKPGRVRTFCRKSPLPVHPFRDGHLPPAFSPLACFIWQLRGATSQISPPGMY